MSERRRSAFDIMQDATALAHAIERELGNEDFSADKVQAYLTAGDAIHEEGADKLTAYYYVSQNLAARAAEVKAEARRMADYAKRLEAEVERVDARALALAEVLCEARETDRVDLPIGIKAKPWTPATKGTLVLPKGEPPDDTPRFLITMRTEWDKDEVRSRLERGIAVPGCSIQYPAKRLQWVGKPKSGDGREG